MAATDMLLKPEECAMLLVDFQAGLGFGVESMSRQVVLNNAVALARTATAFKVPVNRKPINAIGVAMAGYSNSQTPNPPLR
jgi:hypothetical protein